MPKTAIKVPFMLSLPVQLSPNVPAVGRSLCDKLAVLGAVTNVTACIVFFCPTFTLAVCLSASAATVP